MGPGDHLNQNRKPKRGGGGGRGAEAGEGGGAGGARGRSMKRAQHCELGSRKGNEEPADVVG